MEAWIEIIGTIAGGLLASAAAWLNSRFQLNRQTEQERKRAILGKLEDPYQAITGLGESYNVLATTQMMRAFSPDIAPAATSKSVLRSKLRILVSFYAPNLERQLEHLLILANEYRTMIAKHNLLPGGPKGGITKEIDPMVRKQKGLEPFAIQSKST